LEEEGPNKWDDLLDSPTHTPPQSITFSVGRRRGMRREGAEKSIIIIIVTETDSCVSTSWAQSHQLEMCRSSEEDIIISIDLFKHKKNCLNGRTAAAA